MARLRIGPHKSQWCKLGWGKTQLLMPRNHQTTLAKDSLVFKALSLRLSSAIGFSLSHLEQQETATPNFSLAVFLSLWELG